MAREGPEPILPTHDLSATRAFYQALGFRAGYNDDHYEILRRGNLVVHLERWDDLVPASNRASCYWRVADADALYRGSPRWACRRKARRGSPRRRTSRGACANSRSRIPRAT